MNKNLEAVSYTPVERGEVGDSDVLTRSLLAREIPAFVIAQSGVSLHDATIVTGIGRTLLKNGYVNNRNNLLFDYSNSMYAPELLDEDKIMTHNWLHARQEWEHIGVTPMHSDSFTRAGEPAGGYSLNHTQSGAAEFMLHRPIVEKTDSTDEWDASNRLTLNLVARALAETSWMDPNGYIAEIGEGDLLVFDNSYLHYSKTTQTPRHSEAALFELVRQPKHGL